MASVPTPEESLAQQNTNPTQICVGFLFEAQSVLRITVS